MPIDGLEGKVVLVTGGHGFLGSKVVEYLDQIGADTYLFGSRTRRGDKGFDLTRQDDVKKVFTMAYDGQKKIDYVFHLAGYNGGISKNLTEPAKIFYDNTMMSLNVIEACRKFGVEKLVSVVASCAYPSHGVCYEDYFLTGVPHESIEGHGYAKRNIQIASKLYNRQYKCNFVTACPTTLYGPGDRIGPESKVLGSLIQKFIEAQEEGKDTVVCWGTGKPRREFMYVDDCATQLIQVMCLYEDSTKPINLGTGQEFSIKELAELVAQRVGFSGKIMWDTSRPDGEFRKLLACSTSQELNRDFPYTPIADGIDKTIAWYRTQRTKS